MISDEQERVEAKDAHILDIAHAIFHINISDNYDFFCYFQEYVKGLSSGGMQSRHGFEGQLNACWTHKLSTKELDRIRLAGFLVLIIHGR